MAIQEIEEIQLSRHLGPDPMTLSGSIFSLSVEIAELQSMQFHSAGDIAEYVTELRKAHRAMQNFKFTINRRDDKNDIS